MLQVAPEVIKIVTSRIGTAILEEREIEIPASLSVLRGTSEPAKGYCVIRVLNPADGDKRVVWDARSLQQIQHAKELFLNLVKEGMRPYKVDVTGNKTPVVMQEFDPHAEEIIFAPDQKPVLAGG